jgi:hypothetical protein
MHVTDAPGRWAFVLGDYNRDGHPDLYAIDRHDPNGDRTSVHVLNGADGFQSYLKHAGTTMHVTDAPGRWSFVLGDYNRDGHPDLYAIDRHDPNGDRTSVHVLNGADGFQSYLKHAGTTMHVTDAYCLWDFGTGEACKQEEAEDTSTFIANFPKGAPGSFFTFTATNFPPDADAVIAIKGPEDADFRQQQRVAMDAEGNLVIVLYIPDDAQLGTYTVRLTAMSASLAVANAVAQETTIEVAASASQHPRPEGDEPVIPVGPAGGLSVYLPVIIR